MEMGMSLPIRPMMIVDSRWRNPEAPWTPEQERAYIHWDDVVHADDLLRDSGIVRVTRFRPTDNLGTFHIQEYESEKALQDYLVSERRKELIRETQSHYAAGPEADRIFSSRVVRCFIPVATKSLD
jgi:quinol monooxygenase YgiN